MTLINTNALGVTLGETLFSDLNLTISKGDRIGLVAPNGRGKSTLLACLAGETEPTTGEITRGRGLRVGHVTQYVPADAFGQTLYDWALSTLPPDQADYESWRIDVAMDELNIPQDIQQSSVGALSGGWQRTAMLAVVWLSEPDLLLLDEPTNHLDLRRIGFLQEWLAKLPKDVPVVITSHDRAFLDATTNRTLFLRHEHSRAFPLSYSAARLALAESDGADARRFANDLNKVKQLRKQAAKLKNVGINSGSDLMLTKTKQLTDRAAKIEASAKAAHQDLSAGQIRLTNRGTHAKALISFDDVSVTTPDARPLYRTGKKWISQGDRIVLLGANGAGKTQLLRMVDRALWGGFDGIKCAPSVVAAYSDQALSQLPENQTPLAIVVANSDIGDQRARAVLAGAGISKQMQDTPVESLSGGQKARLAMLVLRLHHPNFYLLDEPTNHLDIEGQEALETELIEHGATCLLVSHDRSFLRNVGNRFWLVDRGQLRDIESPELFLNQEMMGE